MSAAESPIAPRDASVRSPRADRVREDWRHVHVDRVSVFLNKNGRRARAVVQLAGLSPADVQVELIPASAADSDSSVCAEDRRMWNTQSYENGSFVFEQVLPQPDVDVSLEWLVRISADEALREPTIRYAFRVARS